MLDRSRKDLYLYSMKLYEQATNRKKSTDNQLTC